MGVTSSGMSGPSGVPSFGSGFRVFLGALLYIFPTAVHHTVWWILGWTLPLVLMEIVELPNHHPITPLELATVRTWSAECCSSTAQLSAV